MDGPMALNVIYNDTTYENTSPWYLTPFNEKFLDIYYHRTIEPDSSDLIFLIEEEKYVNRPDLLAYDVYGDHKLWWVFGVRNGFKDLIFDMKIGTIIIIPTKDTIGRYI